jgi:dipeptidyl-peptidase 4
MALRNPLYCSSLLLALLVVPAASDDTLLTVAEKSEFQATSKHAEVVELCQRLSKASPRVKYSEFGTTTEGRKLPLLVIADPPVGTAAEAAKSGKAIVLAFANIHAGEVDGKEGVLMLARELAQAKDSAILQNVVTLIVPNLNADGNDRFSKENRRSQNGPTQGMGIRANAGGLDLNRDFVKLEAPEIAALVKLMHDWDPHVVVDCHTTNGSYHRYLITYDTSKHPACDERVRKLAVDKMMPELTERLEKKGGWKSFYYGNFSGRDKSVWDTYGHEPRYSTQYVAARNRIGILSESYSYAPYKDRILASKDFVNVILDYAAAHKDEIRQTIAAADKATAEGKGPVAIRAKVVPLPGRYTILGYEDKMENGRRVKPDVPKDYAVTYKGGVEASMTTDRPEAYVFPAKFTQAVENLERHGIQVETLPEEREVAVEVHTVTKLAKARGDYQKHLLVLPLEAEVKKETRRLPAGTFLVKTTQPLGTLAALLLEPRAEDGLTTWNYFDDGLAEGQEHPVLRVVGSPGK